MHQVTSFTSSGGGDVVKPKPRYIKPSVSSSSSTLSSSRPQSAAMLAAVASELNFDSTTNIRTAIFDEWKVQAQKRIKQNLLEKKRMEELEEKKKRV